MDSLPGLSSVDLLVLLKLAAHQDEVSSVRRIGDDLGLSKSSVSNSIRRLRELDLVKDTDERERRINKLAVRGFLEHAVRWCSPAKVGDFELGLPTAHSAEPLANKLSGDDDPLVLPLRHGPFRGRAVSPIHPNAPRAAQADPKLLRLLAIVDAFRVGRARDRQVAAEELRACL
jgi:DNA-binding transcriptional ArsR family regulator